MLEDVLALMFHLQLLQVPINLELKNQIAAIMPFIKTTETLLNDCKREHQPVLLWAPFWIKVLFWFSKYVQEMCCSYKLWVSECKAHQVQKNI